MTEIFRGFSETLEADSGKVL